MAHASSEPRTRTGRRALGLVIGTFVAFLTANLLVYYAGVGVVASEQQAIFAAACATVLLMVFRGGFGP